MRTQAFLERETLSSEPNRVKYQHLAVQNGHLLQTVLELEAQVASLRRINDELTAKSPQAVQILVAELTAQNRSLERALFRLVRSNEQLACDVLMKDQLLCEAEREHREIVDSYEEKVYELRISVQNKETAVIAMEDKINDLREEELYGPASRTNLMHFNEVHELKAMHDRLALENSQLAFLNAVKDEELERLRGALERCEREEGRKWEEKREERREEGRKWREALGVPEASQQAKARKAEARGKLEEELTRYDTKYRHLSTSKSHASSNQLASLKLVITHLNQENRTLRTQTGKLAAALAVRDKQYRLLQTAYNKVKSELVVGKIEVEFYRDNFKELCKVPTERRIKFYDEYYEELLPNLERKLREKQQLITYWKHWEGASQAVIGKCILGRAGGRRRPAKRSNSSPACFSYRAESPRRRPAAGREKEEAIFSFINETHNVDSMVNYTVDAQHPALEQPPVFNDDISVIARPKATPGPYSRKKKKEDG